MKKISFRNPNVWIIAIFIAGIGYLISLQKLLADGVFFSGDSGLKAMIAQNLADGYLAFDLNLPDPPWIYELWHMGMYPFDRPFVYEIEGKYFPQYPFPFPLITAPFYALWGYSGLYVIPWAATIVIWLTFYHLCKRLDISPVAIAIGLFFLMFASHLSFYSATYWEHTLSVCLAFCGISLLLQKQEAKRLSVGTAIWVGVLTSLAIWFRPEQVFVVLFLGILSLWSYLKNTRREAIFQRDFLGGLPDHIGRNGLAIIAASLTTLILYGGLNWFIYKNFFGTHAIQVLEYQPLRLRVLAFLDNFGAMTIGRYSFFVASPIALFVIGCLFVLWIRRANLKRLLDWALWVAFSFAFILGVALLVPESAGGKQWGPRFLLMLVPILALVFTMQMDYLIKSPLPSHNFLRWVVMAIVSSFALVGIIQNPIRGQEYLITNNAPIKKLIDDLRSVPTETIGISNAYLSQVYQPALSREINFVLIPGEYELALFTKVLVEQEQYTFRFLCYSYHCEYFDPAVSSRQVHIHKRTYILHTVKISDYDRYRILDIRIEKSE